jgi:hypothetical protein
MWCVSLISGGGFALFAYEFLMSGCVQAGEKEATATD